MAARVWQVRGAVAVRAAAVLPFSLRAYVLVDILCTVTLLASAPVPSCPTISPCLQTLYDTPSFLFNTTISFIPLLFSTLTCHISPPLARLTSSPRSFRVVHYKPRYCWFALSCWRLVCDYVYVFLISLIPDRRHESNHIIGWHYTGERQWKASICAPRDSTMELANRLNSWSHASCFALPFNVYSRGHPAILQFHLWFFFFLFLHVHLYPCFKVNRISPSC